MSTDTREKPCQKKIMLIIVSEEKLHHLRSPTVPKQKIIVISVCLFLLKRTKDVVCESFIIFKNWITDFSDLQISEKTPLKF